MTPEEVLKKHGLLREMFSSQYLYDTFLDAMEEYRQQGEQPSASLGDDWKVRFYKWWKEGNVKHGADCEKWIEENIVKPMAQQLSAKEAADLLTLTTQQGRRKR